MLKIFNILTEPLNLKMWILHLMKINKYKIKENFK
jgi:hypothetical protein